MDCGPDPQLLAMLVDHLPALTKQLGISPNTKVFIGPRDHELRGSAIWPRQRYADTIGEIGKNMADGLTV